MNNPLLLDNDGYAFHLANTFFIPIKAPEKGETFEEYTRAKSLPWMIDRETVFAEIKPSLEEMMGSKELNEIYQHLRLTFSNWLSNEGSSLKKEIQDVIENLRPILFEKGIKVDLLIPERISIFLDKNKIFQVISNLVSNAIKFSPQGAVIKLELMEKDQDYLFFVEDIEPVS